MLCAFNFNSKVRSTVQPPLTVTSLQQPLFLVDSPYTESCLNLSTTFTFLSVPKVAVVKGFNCTVVNAKQTVEIIGWAIAHPAHDTAVFFRDRSIYFSLCFCNLEKDEWSSKCLSFLLLVDQMCQFMRK